MRNIKLLAALVACVALAVGLCPGSAPAQAVGRALPPGTTVLIGGPIAIDGGAIAVTTLPPVTGTVTALIDGGTVTVLGGNIASTILGNPIFTLDGGSVVVYSAPSFTTALLDGTQVGITPGQEVGLVAGTTVSLSSTSLDAITGGICEVFDRHWQSVGTSVAAVPADGGTPGRTAIHLTNRDGTREMTCTVNSTPTFGAPGLGHWLAPNGGVVHLPVRDSDVVQCIANTAGGTNNLVVNEESCVASGP